ncbi:MAG: PqqD family protein [Methyloceanibacter sp.]|nr:PqqD family protein [Methyloceanibacter sp.]
MTSVDLTSCTHGGGFREGGGRHVAVLELCDGKRTVGDIVEALAKEYSAPADVIRTDVLDLLQGLADKGFIKG